MELSNLRPAEGSKHSDNFMVQETAKQPEKAIKDS